MIDELRLQVASTIDEVIAVVEGCDADDWERQCVAEGWPVGIEALHIGLGLRRQASWIAGSLRGEEAFDFNWDDTHAINARVLARGTPAKDLAMRQIEKGRERLMELLAQIRDDDLGRVALTYGGRRLDVDHVLRRIVIPHAAGHLASIRKATGLVAGSR